jgi:hypothetical protein
VEISNNLWKTEEYLNQAFSAGQRRILSAGGIVMKDKSVLNTTPPNLEPNKTSS